MSQSNKTKNCATTSTVSNAFENEMEDELDQIYHNFITRGTFELPLSSKFSNHLDNPLPCFLFSSEIRRKKESSNQSTRWR
jgi:hypothetical protein